MMTGYEITFSITAVCPCCGKDLPSNSYLTVSKSGNGPFDRDNPYERKDRRVFITPCADCFEWRGPGGPDRGGDDALLLRALRYLESEAVSHYGPQGLESMVAAGDHPVVADLRARLAPRTPDESSAVRAAAPGGQP